MGSVAVSNWASDRWVARMNDAIQDCDQVASDDPRFAYGEDTFAPPPGTWAPDCGHPRCLEDDQDCVTYGGQNGHEWGCPVAECRWDAARASCELATGHSGDHSYALPSLVALATGVMS